MGQASRRSFADVHFVAGDDSPRGDAAGHDGAGSDRGAIADCHARRDHTEAADHHIVADANGLDALTVEREHMHKDACLGPDNHVVAEGDHGGGRTDRA